MSYTKPDQVTSPRARWSLIAILDEGSEGTTALALGRWDGTLRIAMRWNGNTARPQGNPQSRGLATWFIVEDKYYEAIMASGVLSADKLTLVRTFIPQVTAGQ